MQSETYRLLIADDTPALHETYRSIFAANNGQSPQFPGAEKFAPELVIPAVAPTTTYETTHVTQGEDALTAAATPH